ncbi:MAG TPA: alpha/beta fold hydrolase [Actinomycetota bacterium]|jgi:pimeloyl-ACP methyl ester carboxylesterase
MLADLGDIQLDYWDRGEGPPVLGVMGFALDKRFWAAQIPAVTAGNRFIAFDNRGTGRSSRDNPPTTIDEAAADAIRLLDHLEIERTTVFGVSMGGTIAQRIALDYPERVSALILGVTWARPLEYMLRRHTLGRLILRVGTLEDFSQSALLQMFTPRFFELGVELIERMIASIDAPGAPPVATAETLMTQLDALDKHDVLADLPRIDVPTLVLGGRMDMTVPYFASEEIAGAIPGAKLVTFETGHGCMIEEMDAFNRAVTEFLASLR